MKLILASGSPRRKEILSMITNNFEVIVSNCKEEIDSNITAEEQVKHLASMKAQEVFEKTKEIGDRIVIGSDTIVVKDEKIYGKPSNYDDAFRMIKELKNSTHKVMTGICILIYNENTVKEIAQVDVSSVHITDISDNEIEKWLSTGDAYDKAGAYAIQGKFSVFIDKIEGNYFSIVGLPINRVYNAIKEYI